MPEPTTVPDSALPPYQIVIQPVTYFPIINNNPFQQEIDQFVSTDARLEALNKLNEEAKGTKFGPITESDLEKALQYMKVTELKAGGFLQAKDGKVSYTDLAKVAKSVENVTDKDVSFGGKMPRFFTIDAVPHVESKEYFIINNLDVDHYKSVISSIAFYEGKTDSMTARRDALQKLDAEQVKDAFAHEYGHRLGTATHGAVFAVYDVNAHAQALTGKTFSEVCKVDTVLGEIPTVSNPTTECFNTRYRIKLDIGNVEKILQEEQAYIQIKREEIADTYMALARPNSGKNIGEFLVRFEQGSALLGTGPLADIGIFPIPADGVKNHPSSQNRNSIIEKAKNNPAASKAGLEAALAEFSKYVSSGPTSTNHNLKSAPPLTASPPTTGQEAARQ